MLERKITENKQLLKLFIEELASESDDDLSYLLEDSNDEEIIYADANPRKRKRSEESIEEAQEPCLSDEVQFLKNFRVSRSLFEVLTAQFANSEEYTRLRVDKRYPADKNIEVLLWFAGHAGCSARHLAKKFNLSISTACVILNRAVTFLSSLADEVIRWPGKTEKDSSSNFFRSKTGFPKVIGAIDATHVFITVPAVGKDDYINQKGNPSLILQAICNEKKKFIDIFVGCPGSLTKSRVFQNSSISSRLRKSCRGYIVLGDPAYPCMDNLLTPYRDNGRLTRSQKEFNTKLYEGKAFIEHSFAQLRRRFPQLHFCKLKSIDKLCNFVKACCVLHNLADEDDLQFMTEGSIIHEACAADLEIAEDSSSGIRLRNKICEELGK